MAASLRVGIIGTGRAGQCQARAFSLLPNVRVAALWNRTRSKAEQLASTLKSPRIEIFDDWRHLIESSQVDIVSIATDPIIRLEPFAHAVAKQRHVLVEKPLALGLPEAEAMAAVAGQADTVTAICFNWRYSPACRTMWRAIREGQIGKLLDIQTAWRLCFSPGLKPWTAGSGSLREAGSHEFDRAGHLTGWQFRRLVCSLRSESPVQSSCQPRRPETFASVLAEMSDEAIGNFQITISPGEPQRRITICGEEGTLTMTSQWVSLHQGNDDRSRMTLCNELQVVRQSAQDRDPVLLEVAASDRQPAGVLSGQHTWNRLIADFVSAVRRRDKRHLGVPHLPHVSDGLAAQRVIHACELSHAERRWIDLTQTRN